MDAISEGNTIPPLMAHKLAAYSRRRLYAAHSAKPVNYGLIAIAFTAMDAQLRRREYGIAAHPRKTYRGVLLQARLPHGADCATLPESQNPAKPDYLPAVV